SSSCRRRCPPVAPGWTTWSTRTARFTVRGCFPRTKCRGRPGRAPPSMAGKLYIRTFGCQMNEYDSGRMEDVLRAARGLELTDRPEEADVILFNTCSVREKAQEK